MGRADDHIFLFQLQLQLRHLVPANQGGGICLLGRTGLGTLHLEQARLAHHDAGNQARVQAPREQHAKRHVGHQALADGGLERGAQLGVHGLVLGRALHGQLLLLLRLRGWEGKVQVHIS
jgi:hypothetical protein